MLHFQCAAWGRKGSFLTARAYSGNHHRAGHHFDNSESRREAFRAAPGLRGPSDDAPQGPLSASGGRLSAPGRQETARDHKPVPGKVSGPLGADVANKITTSDVRVGDDVASSSANSGDLQERRGRREDQGKGDLASALAPVLGAITSSEGGERGPLIASWG